MVVKNLESVNARSTGVEAKPFRFPEGVTRRDRQLCFRWSADYDALNALIGLPSCSSKKMERVMASIVVDVILAGPFQRTSYSRSHDFYVVPARYRATDYGYDTVVGAVDRLVMTGLLIEHFKATSRITGTGWQSSFIGSPVLYRVREIPTAAVRRPGDVIKMKDAKSGKLIAYQETRRTVADRKVTEAVNARIRNAEIVLDAPTIAEQNAHVIRFKTDDDHGEHSVYPEMTELYRVYNGGWTLGGRYYGGWWQSVRAADRKHFIIDGERTVEEDYEQLHPRLLYAHAGEVLVGDAYTIDGWDRKLCKRAFNVLLNAGNFFEAKASISGYAGDEASALKLIEAIKRRHFRVRKFFHSGIGIRLQNLDSEMAKIVLTEMTVRHGITVLPVHDSFIVPASARERLVRVMKEAFDRVTEAQRKVGKDDDGEADSDEDAAYPVLVNRSQTVEGKSIESSYRGVGGGGPPEALSSDGDGSISSLPSGSVAVTVRDSVVDFSRPDPSIPSVVPPLVKRVIRQPNFMKQRP
ncbi:hypothetical protein [Tardiphaga sp. 841_E9_N1_2]|uniref:hypothetical protein n=1 Tax=Tardiphaga sp. 841_E9_N1_2 TaxID=3240762 RepID=UPI003F23ACFE